MGDETARGVVGLIPIGALLLMTQQAAQGAEVTLQVSGRAAGLFAYHFLMQDCQCMKAGHSG